MVWPGSVWGDCWGKEGPWGAPGQGGSRGGEGRWVVPINHPWLCYWQDFDRLLEAMKSALAEDSQAAFVFNCSSGRGRTTTAMVIAVLTLWHFNVGTGVCREGDRLELGLLGKQMGVAFQVSVPTQRGGAGCLVSWWVGLGVCMSAQLSGRP